MTKQIPQAIKHRPANEVAFLIAIDNVCREHGMSLSHEDYQGAFLLLNYNYRDRDKLWCASAQFENPVQRPTVK